MNGTSKQVSNLKQNKVSPQHMLNMINRVKLANNRPLNKVGRRRSDMQATQNPFGPVSTIDTAPVSIGNSIRGSSPVITSTSEGTRVQGRDFLLTVDIINNNSGTWTLAGGAPLTPSCMSTSILKQYSNTYAEYKVHGFAFHYITSATTSTPGSIMMYVGKDRAAPGVNTSSANLLPYVLSDQSTVITPVWQNASAMYVPVPMWRSTGLGNDEGLHEQACGELFVLDKSVSANTPGYILMDYDITFRVMQVNIKALTFPVTRMKYTQMSLSHAGSNTVANNTTAQMAVTGVLLDGSTATANPSGFQLGDVYKCIMNLTNSTLATFTPANLFSLGLGDSQFSALTIADGFTCFAAIQSASTWKLFPTYEDAITNSNPLFFGLSATSPTIQTYWYASLVGTMGSSLMQANY